MKREGTIRFYARTAVQVPKHSYLDNPDECPVCGNTIIMQDGQPEATSSRQFRRKLYCEECDARWTEVFQLSNIVRSN